VDYSDREERTPLNKFVANVDWLMLGSTVFLVLTGLLSVFSATLHYGNPGKFSTTQLAAVMTGLGGLIFFLSFNYQFFRQWSNLLYVFASLMLMTVLFLGTTVRGTKGWFHIGFLSFQPVEMTKIMFIVALAGFLDKNWRDMKHFSKVATALAMLFGQIVLILLQPDFGSTLVFFPVTLILLYIAGVETLYLFGMVLFSSLAMGIPLLITFIKLQPSLMAHSALLSYIVTATKGGLPAIIILSGFACAMFALWWFLDQMKIRLPLAYVVVFVGIFVSGSLASGLVQKSLKDYQRKRLIVFLKPDIDSLGSGYNIIQSKIAIGSGRILGKGLFQGTQSQLGFLPEEHTDFIFAVIGEETGYVISQLVILAYFLLVWRAMVIARESRDRFGSLVAIGIAGMFAFYGTINMGMVMGMMPSTGLPLPLLSYGGSSMVSSMCALGMLLSIHIRRFTH